MLIYEIASSEQYGLFRLYQQLREELLATLTDADLAFTPGGDNLPLGRLCVEIGETERSYVDSFVHFSQNFDYRHADRAIESSVAGLRAWYEQLDAELYAAVAALSDDDVAQRHIARGHGFRVQMCIRDRSLAASSSSGYWRSSSARTGYAKCYRGCAPGCWWPCWASFWWASVLARIR